MTIHTFNNTLHSQILRLQKDCEYTLEPQSRKQLKILMELLKRQYDKFGSFCKKYVGV